MPSDSNKCIFIQQPFWRNLSLQGTIYFDILIFEGQIDVDALENSLNLLEGYFSIQKNFNREKITFTLLKALPHVKHLWETYWEKSSTEESVIYGVDPT
jgi:hypothetical protein